MGKIDCIGVNQLGSIASTIINWETTFIWRFTMEYTVCVGVKST